jgi:pimeloyl-ACP methyl ester carboxylesterase
LNRREFFRVIAASTASTALKVKADVVIGAGRPRCREMTVAEFHSARKFTATKYGRVSYLDVGDGPAALFLHGFPLNSFQWRGAIPQLSMMRRCIAPDFLALGYTEVSEGQSVGPQAQLSMLIDLLDGLSISSVDIVANDSGGAIAQLLVTRYPDRVKSLLLTNCDSEKNCPPPAVLPVIELGRNGKFANEWLAPWLANKSLARSENGLGGQCYADPNHPSDDAVETYLGPLVSSARRKELTNAYAAALAPNPLAGIEPALRRCHVPTRIVWGTGDTIFASADADYLASTVANSLGVRRIPRAKLFFPEEMPEVMIEEAQSLWSL